MHADFSGKGPKTFLFIHGFGGSGMLWAAQAEYFRQYGRVVTVDLPGHGQSHWNDENLSDMAAQVSSVLDDKSIMDNVFVIANSFGGLVALKLWEQQPDTVKAFVFAGAIPRFTFTEDFPAWINARRIRRLSEQFDGDVKAVLEGFYCSLFTKQESEGAAFALIKQFYKEVLTPSRAALDAFLGILESADMREVIKGVSVPMQFIFGDEDRICPMTVLEPLQALCPSARMSIMKGCGHFPFLSRPDEFNQLVKDFVA